MTDNELRSAVLRHYAQVVNRLIRHAPREVLLDAIAQQTGYGTLTYLVSWGAGIEWVENERRPDRVISWEAPRAGVRPNPKRR